MFTIDIGSSAFEAAGFLVFQFELLKRRGRVVGLSFALLAVDRMARSCHAVSCRYKDIFCTSPSGNCSKLLCEPCLHAVQYSTFAGKRANLLSRRKQDTMQRVSTDCQSQPHVAVRRCSSAVLAATLARDEHTKQRYKSSWKRERAPPICY